MKETLYTIPLTDAFLADDECPFCYIQRKLEQDSLDYILGSASAYMQSDIRQKTNTYGFCSMHYKKMFDYGNSLGNAIMLQSYIRELQKNLHKKLNGFSFNKRSLFGKRNKENSEGSNTSIGSYIKTTTEHCFICRQIEHTFERYIDTFFFLLRTNTDFYPLFKKGKGFCLCHFGILVEASEQKLNSRQRDDFRQVLFPQMEEHLKRLEEDVSWFIEKFDSRNREADWKTSKDAVQRCMQKVTTGYPADYDYRSK